MKGITLAAGLILSLATHTAIAEGPPLDLAWVAPPECPSQTRILVEIARMLRGSAAPTSEPIEARAEVEQLGPDQWRVRLETTRASDKGTRELAGESCLAIAEATVLILVLMIDPNAAVEQAPDLREPVAPPPPPPPPPPAPAPPPPKPRAPPVVTDEGCPPRFALGAMVLGDVGSVPPPWVGVGGGGLMSLCRFTMGVWIRGFPPREARLNDDTEAGGSFWLVTGAATVGWDAVDDGIVELGPQLGIEAGALSGTGENIAHPETTTGGWLALETGGWLAVLLGGQVRARVDVAAMFPFIRERYFIGDGATVHRPSIAVGRAALGLVISL